MAIHVFFSNYSLLAKASLVIAKKTISRRIVGYRVGRVVVLPKVSLLVDYSGPYCCNKARVECIARFSRLLCIK